MDEVTVPSFRLALKEGTSVPGKPDLLIGKQIGTSLYTWNHIHELDRVKDQQQQQSEDSGLAIKVCWQPAGVPLGMSLRAMEHEWVMYQNIEVFCQRHPELTQHFLHAHSAILTSAARNTLGCCRRGPEAAAANLSASSSSSSSHGGRGSSVSSNRSQLRVRQVSPTEAAASVFSTDRPSSVGAIIVDRAHGKTVQQQIKQEGFNDIVYVAEVLLQLVPVLATLQRELGFNHDDMRLDNILETWQLPLQQQAHHQNQRKHKQQHQQHQQRQQQQQQRDQHQQHHHHRHQQQQHGQASRVSSRGCGDSSDGGSGVTFKLFDFGLSMINPDKYSEGKQARGSPEEKQQALRRLQEQGYVFHKALGAVSLFHVFQFGRAADIFRMCKALSQHLSGRTWPAADQQLVAACFKLLSAVSCKKLTASFSSTVQAASAAQHCQHQPRSSDIGGSISGSINGSSSKLDWQQLGQGGDSSDGRSQGNSIRPHCTHCTGCAPAGADTSLQGVSTSASSNKQPVRKGASGASRSRSAGNPVSTSPAYPIGSTVIMKFKPAGIAADAGNAVVAPRGLKWVQGLWHKQQQRKQARAITALQMLDLPLFKELQAAMK